METPPKKKIRMPPYKGLRPPPRSRNVLPVWAVTALSLSGFLTIAAIGIDAYILSHPAKDSTIAKTPADLLLAVTTATNRYVDPQKKFSIAKPAGWTVRFGDDGSDFDAKLEGPDRLVLYVVAADAPGETMENLKKTFADMEQNEGRATHITETTFHGLPAISRFTRMDLNALRSLDFLSGETSFHLMGLIPREEFDSHRAVIEALMETLQPGAQH